MHRLYLALAVMVASACSMEAAEFPAHRRALASLHLELPSEPLFIGSFT